MEKYYGDNEYKVKTQTEFCEGTILFAFLNKCRGVPSYSYIPLSAQSPRSRVR